MKNCVIRPGILVICIALLAMPLFGQRGRGGSGGGGGGGGSTACAIVVTPTLSSSTATAGGESIGIFSRITNCSSGKGRYTVTVSAVSSCGEETIIASSVISFSGGESKLISIPYIVAPDTCRGASSVFVNVYSGGNLLASQSAPLTIQ